MNPSTHPELYAFYASPGLMTSPGAYARLFEGLPTDIPVLCKIVQGLLTHPLLTELYGIVLTPTQKKEVNIRPVSEMLERVFTLDSRSLSEARPPNERLVGNCRDHALLLCAMLRCQGRPARVRCGFATYLGEGFNHDHWVTEVWDGQRGAWFLVDPQIDELQRAHFKLTFDPAHLPPEQFYTAARTWALCRKGKAKSRDFGVNKKTKGWPFLRAQLLRELAALNKVELLAWDNWWPLGVKEEIQVSAAERKTLDHIAATINGLDEQFDELRILYDDPDFSDPLHSRLKLMGLNVEESASSGAPPRSGEGPEENSSRLTSGEAGTGGVREGSPSDGQVEISSPPRSGEGTGERFPIRISLLPSDLDLLTSLSGEAQTPVLPGSNGHPSVLSNGYAKITDDPNLIIIRGAQQHNLKHVNLSFPRNKLVVLTGVSGSGKSSLAFDTLYAEGQRRYVESLNSYVRRYLDQMDKPKVDYIGGLSPAISIEQKSVSKNPRSTVGTITEVLDYLRVLFSRAGTQHCPQCGRAVEPISPQMATDRLLRLPAGTRFQLIAPLTRSRKGDHTNLLEQARADGFTRARIDGVTYELHDLKKLPRLLKSQAHTLEIIVDRLVVPNPHLPHPQPLSREERGNELFPSPFGGRAGDEGGDGEDAGISTRVIDSVETALRAGKGSLIVQILGAPGSLTPPSEFLLSEHNTCLHCQVTLPKLTAALFSFNAPTGMCPECNGLGTKMQVDPALIVEHPDLSILDGASRWWGNVRKKRGWRLLHLDQVAKHFGADLELPWKDLPQVFRDALIWGSEEKFAFKWENEQGTWKGEGTRQERGAVYDINRLFRQTSSEGTRRWYGSFMSQKPCESCGGTRLCAEARYVTAGGITFPTVLDMTIQQAYDWACALSSASASEHFNPGQIEVVGEVLKEIRSRLRFMLDVGLHYLNLSRPAPTLSGGEGQRIRLASQLGCGLVGVLYILDEPSIGLHARDQRNLLNTLTKLRDLGNTVLVVEHDADTMLSADWLVDLGPGAGIKGGEVVAEGTPAEVMANPSSLTGQYLAGKLQVTAPNGQQRREPKGWIELSGARLFNLKNITARFPLGAVTVVTGVSGSGKSSLVAETLYPALARALMNAQTSPGPYDRLTGLDQLDKVIDITQDPIGRTPRSNPATYVGVFDEIRQVFATTPEARMRGYSSARFSFNVKGGRCEACAGHGLKRVEMHFLPDVWVTCQECKGARYNRHTLEVTYKGKNIAEALAMDVQEALEFFGAYPKITRMLQTLHDVGLDYVKLGQSATTLSGGEAQRVKLAKELGRVSTGDTIYILDEPTTGLHFADIQRLLDVLHRLVDAGNTVIIIEHNMDVIKTSDWLIDLGPEGGAAGGSIIAEGTPEQVARVEASYTGRFLRDLFPVPEGVNQ